MTTQLSTQTQVGFSAFDLMMDEAVMARFERMAKVMASSRSTIPKHLHGNEGDCMAVIMQAAQWKMNPYAVAQKTHLVNGTLGYEAQLIKAVIDGSSLTIGRLDIEFFGDWKGINGKADTSWDRGVNIIGTLKGCDEPKVITITMGQVGSVRNSPLWGNDPKQQLAYLAIKRWSRLYTPDLILGVYDEDELAERKEIDITPEVEVIPKHQGTSNLKARLDSRNQQSEEVVDLTVKAFDALPLIAEIKAAQTLDELKAVVDKLPTEIDEPAQTNIKNAYNWQKFYLQLVIDLEAANEIEAVNAIMGERFEPNTSGLDESQIASINSIYERKEAELSA